MRHLIGLVLAVLMGAALFLGGGWGVNKITRLHASGASLTSTHGLIAIAALGVVGLLLGIVLAAPGISPLAAGLPGLVLLGWSALLVVSASRATRLIPLRSHTFATGFSDLLTTGVLILLGAVMIVPLFVPSRWRRRDGGEDDDYADDEPSEVGLMR
jgi:hypothetical protein